MDNLSQNCPNKRLPLSLINIRPTTLEIILNFDSNKVINNK